MRAQALILLVLAACTFGQLLNNYQVVQLSKQATHLTAILNYTGTDQYYQKPTSPIYNQLNFTVKYDSVKELTVTIKPIGVDRFQIPSGYPFPSDKDKTTGFPEYTVNVTNNPFSFAISRSATGETIFNTSGYNFVFSELFMTIGTSLPTQYFYGWGERASSFLYNSGLYTTWNKDQYCQIDSGQGGQQLYGTHPMYLMKENSDNWHVVFLKNINAMDLDLDVQAQTAQFILVGGIIEYKIFLGNKNPENVINQYHKYINGYMIHTFWTLGYHQSKWGLIYLQDMVDVLQNFTNYQIPLDVIWSDIDYMYTFTDFTIDNDRYPISNFSQLAQQWRWVPIVDAGVSINYSAPAYIQGTQMNVWIESVNNDSNPLIGVVWPGIVHWTDFFHPNASAYWRNQLKTMHDQVPYAGIWLDMNELSNFCYGEYPIDCTYLSDYLPPSDSLQEDALYKDIKIEQFTAEEKAAQREAKRERKISERYERVLEKEEGMPGYNYFPYINTSVDLPYLPGGLPLENKTISMDVLHYGDFQEYDVHNLNGFLETITTYEALITITGKKPFILSRSTYVGSGQFATHWTGDNFAAWEFLQISIPEVLNFNLYGIPMTGADICGFAGNTTEELCSRWMQLGAWYPFMRNHMSLTSIDHFPWSFGPTLLQASMASLQLRYSILKYFFALFIKGKGHGTIFRPVFFNFPGNDWYLLSLDTQFMIGEELLVIPAIQEGVTTVEGYFPANSKFYDFQTGAVVQDIFNPAQNITVNAPLNGTAPTFLRGGYLIPVQNVSNITNTDQLTNSFNLVVGLLQVSNTTSTSSGIILGISSYSLEANVQYCLLSDCILNINVTAVTQSSGSVVVTLTIANNKATTLVQTNFLNTVTLYGIRRDVCPTTSTSCQDSVASYTFPTGTLIKSGSYQFTV